LQILGYSVSSSITCKQGPGLVEVATLSSGAWSSKRRRAFNFMWLSDCFQGMLYDGSLNTSRISGAEKSSCVVREGRPSSLTGGLISV